MPASAKSKLLTALSLRRGWKAELLWSVTHLKSPFASEPLNSRQCWPFQSVAFSYPHPVVLEGLKWHLVKAPTTAPATNNAFFSPKVLLCNVSCRHSRPAGTKNLFSRDLVFFPPFFSSISTLCKQKKEKKNHRQNLSLEGKKSHRFMTEVKPLPKTLSLFLLLAKNRNRNMQ